MPRLLLAQRLTHDVIDRWLLIQPIIYSYHNLQRRHPLRSQGDESFITNTHLGAAYL